MDLSFESSLRSPLHEGTSLSPVRRGDSGAPGFILGARAARAQPARRTRMSAALDDESDEEAGCADDAKLPAAAQERANAAQAGEAGEEQVMAQRSPEDTYHLATQQLCPQCLLRCVGLGEGAQKGKSARASVPPECYLH